MLNDKVTNPSSKPFCKFSGVASRNDFASSHILHKPRRENDRAVCAFRRTRRQEDRQPIIVVLRHPLQFLQQEAVMPRRFVLKVLRPRRQRPLHPA